MTQHDLRAMRQEVISAVDRLLSSGIMQVSHHGNMTLRVPGTDTFLFTAAGGLDNLKPESIALIDLDGNVLEGTVEPTSMEVVAMHTIVFKLREETGSVLHTHSPSATAFALAEREIPVAYEGMVRMLGGVPIPVAEYGPRGSDVSVKNIARLLEEREGMRALLLGNHGTLTWGTDPASAVQASITLEESALVTLNAEVLGGAKPIPPHMINAAQQRVTEFQRQGPQSA